MRLWMNEPLSRHTSFQIGGPAERMAAPENETELLELVLQKPAAIIGAGTNLLVRDEGISGLVVKIGAEMADISIEGNILTAQAGARLSQIAMAAMRAGLSGLEFAAGIPGTVGGAVVMNAGAYGGEIKDVLIDVRVIADGEIKTLTNEQLEFGYRKSLAMEMGYIIAGARFLLTPDSPEAISARMRELAQKRRDKQPLEMPSAGSTFKRPEGHFAGALIEGAGLKGFSVGGAQVSEKHAGFVVNTGGATCADVLGLIEKVQSVVREKYGIELEMEVCVL
ncbi:MAG: UDP-N-acetylmuramate dehydrogenase [Clostridiales bacterium]|nr:UDP-N-acetylmuramate dehydrogenase [Clostridiales bacterium]